ncbi:uncharacterized protein MELLADRAFT_88711 [Melampsora larici-populina 98AG31]|uniref:CxC1-like cysteine cluster associated with KDZ transposases domain-containing protein n=1 Tax=Melampsora larici-populina (strain 98AG31 / pathotype 3-4-7) TaxID=747676 RepID=F4RSQ6_MELLP|nr:uncharacterized protein MELLADRAFT_88711 [Melampsora larici-populina 98AG31]EGG04643.1 hypothetical protein MELLADRAFT_88711 [Melampsora larici-populina 98AG31]
MPPKGQGRSMPCPLGPIKKPRTARPPEGLAKLIAQVEASNSQFLQNRTGQIERALASGPPCQIPAEPLNHKIEFELPGHIASSDEDDANDQHSNILVSNADPLPPNVDVTFRDYIRGEYYKNTQLTEVKNWAKVLNPMFIAFMSCARKASQWGDPRLWGVDHNSPCSCGVGDTQTRAVDMVDILERKQDQLFFCKCTPDQVRLIRMGYIGGSPIYPQTAYSIRLLRLHHALWKYCTVRVQGYWYRQPSTMVSNLFLGH